MLKRLSYAAVTAMAASFLFTAASAQSVKIVSPPPGTIVAPGQQFDVTVTVDQGSGFTGVVVVRQGMGVTNAITSPPYIFSLHAPVGLDGPLKLLAMGLKGESSVISEPTTIHVEQPLANLASITASRRSIPFSYIGSQLPVIVSATFLDGTTANITRSPRTIYSSSNANVVRIEAGGLVTAVGPGNATVDIGYGNKTFSIAASVPTNRSGDLNGDNEVDNDDVNVLTLSLNTLSTGPSDARDLNRDGKIDALDARLLTALCTRPRCATQ